MPAQAGRACSPHASQAAAGAAEAADLRTRAAALCVRGVAWIANLPAATRPYHTTTQVARSGACAAELGGRLYVCGGLGHEGGLRSV